MDKNGKVKLSLSKVTLTLRLKIVNMIFMCLKLSLLIEFMKRVVCEISGFCISEYEDGYILGCYTM